MAKYIIIQTKSERYKCHGYSRKAGRIYFNGHAVNMANVVSITLADGSIAYENKNLTVEKKPRVCAHHVSTLKGAVKCKATTKPRTTRPVATKKKSNLPDVIEI